MILVQHADPATVKLNPVIQFQPSDPTTMPTVTIQLDTGDEDAWDDDHYGHFLHQLEKQGVKKLYMRYMSFVSLFFSVLNT